MNEILSNEFILYDRIEKIKQIINQYGEDNFYISFSGGKDSCVLSELIDEALPQNQIPRVYFNTGIEFQMMVDFVKEQQKQDKRIVMLEPKVPIRKMLETESYPFKSKDHSKRLCEYQVNHRHNNTTRDYVNRENHFAGGYGCPKCLQYQFDEDFKLKVSDKCCTHLKKDIGAKWAQENGKTWAITGIRADEGGARRNAHCIVLKKGKNKFHPLLPVSNEFIEWYIEKSDIRLCDLYKPPFNFERTGCKGCPFNIKIQKELDLLEKHLPNEYKQCETIWRPVYEEYRRIGYRLKKENNVDGQKNSN